jgi:hypothetical protein
MSGIANSFGRWLGMTDYTTIMHHETKEASWGLKNLRKGPTCYNAIYGLVGGRGNKGRLKGLEWRIEHCIARKGVLGIEGGCVGDAMERGGREKP